MYTHTLCYSQQKNPAPDNCSAQAIAKTMPESCCENGWYIKRYTATQERAKKNVKFDKFAHFTVPAVPSVWLQAAGDITEVTWFSFCSAVTGFMECATENGDHHKPPLELVERERCVLLLCIPWYFLMKIVGKNEVFLRILITHTLFLLFDWYGRPLTFFFSHFLCFFIFFILLIFSSLFFFFSLHFSQFSSNFSILSILHPFQQQKRASKKKERFNGKIIYRQRRTKSSGFFRTAVYFAEGWGKLWVNGSEQDK